jgi:SAM-dependent methyltransferase
VDIRNFGPLPSAIAKVNARHPWNHNEYFHGWILRNLPERRRVAVDIGCGAGALAGKLAACFTHVTGIDADEGMAAAASARLADVPQASIRQCNFAEFISAADDGGADLITMVAVLHWLDLDDTLARIPALLAPGGRLLVVGLARADSLADLGFDVVSGAVNPVMGMIKHPRPARPSQRGPDGQPVTPVQDPVTTFAEITTAAKAHLPGVTVRRRLFFRYTLRWDKPQEPRLPLRQRCFIVHFLFSLWLLVVARAAYDHGSVSCRWPCLPGCLREADVAPVR